MLSEITCRDRGRGRGIGVCLSTCHPDPWHLTSTEYEYPCLMLSPRRDSSTGSSSNGRGNGKGKGDGGESLSGTTSITEEGGGSSGLGGNNRHAAAAAACMCCQPLQLGTAQPLRLGGGHDRDGLLYVSSSYSSLAPTPAIVLLHGAASDASSCVASFLEPAEKHSLIVLAPESRSVEGWDDCQHGLNRDAAFIDRCLSLLFNRCAVDLNRIAVAGFRDGASLAIALGVNNSHLFSHVLAFDPNDVVLPWYEDSPPMYIAHSKDACNVGQDVPTLLRSRGYRVFENEHPRGDELSADGQARAIRDAVTWFTNGRKL